MKQCKECGKNKNDTEFYKKKEGYLSAKCRDCVRIYNSHRGKGPMQDPILSREEAKILNEQIYG